MRVQQLIVGWQNVSQNGAAFYTRQEYVKYDTKTLVVSERPLSD